MKEKAVKRAKANVLREFYVIGIMEQFENTLELFEHTMPNFFSGVTKLWSTRGKRNKFQIWRKFL